MSLSHTNLTNNLALWRLYIEVCHKGSISAVAKDHQVDPSTISRKLSALESSLGVRFLSRSTRSLSLTTAGVDALMQAQSMLDVYEIFCRRSSPTPPTSRDLFALQLRQPSSMNSSGSGLPNFKDCTQMCISTCLQTRKPRNPIATALTSLW